MKFSRALVLSGAVLCLFVPFSNARFALPPPAPRATIGHYNGDAAVNLSVWSAVNGDVPPVFVGASCPAPAVFGPLVGNADNAKAVVGFTWGPILNIGPCVGGAAGVAIIKVRPACTNGPTVTLPGGCLGEVLIVGTKLGGLQVAHNGITCNIPNLLIPPAAMGLSWAAQATVRGGGFVELSSVLYGVVNACF